MKRSALRIICFLAVLITVLYGWNSVFRLKYGDGIYGVTKFYQQEKDTVDVLFLGSSHAFENINTGILWDDHGMSSYILAGTIQPMWNTYYYLKEALKTQSPELIVLEGYCTSFSREYSDDTRIIKNNYGLRWSPDKIRSLMVSAPRERWREFFLEYTQYHTRYKELTREDFIKDQGNPLFRDWKGFGCHMDTEPQESIDVSGVTGRKELFPKTEEYYRATLRLAKDSGIPVIVIISPYAGISEDEQKVFNRAGDIAEEMGVPFVNFNLMTDDIGLDYTEDAGDTDHLNYKGNQKYTHFLGDYLSGKYDIPDHRGDEKYASWERDAGYLRKIIHEQELLDGAYGGGE